MLSTAYITTTVAITIGGSVAKETITFGADAYDVGAEMSITITATDASGNPVADGKATPGLTGNKAVGGALPSASQYVGGVKTTAAASLFAPAVAC